MDNIPASIATFIQKLKAVKSLLENDFGNLTKTYTNGAMIKTMQ